MVFAEADAVFAETVVRALAVAAPELAGSTLAARPLWVGATVAGQSLEAEDDEGWAEQACWSSMTFVCRALTYSMSSSRRRRQRTRRPSVPTVGRAA